ncbi:MAG: TrkA family potassium uptake protein [Lachnospiraceae bacterium]|nr:TrkA family potassium uptake protein [Lachnospiraceae bacterium]
MRDIAVIGLGKFGVSVALNYSKRGGNVLAIDKDEIRVQEIADVVTSAVRVDMTDSEAVANLGLDKMDAVVVAIADSLEASVMATILAKEQGVPYIIVKAKNQMHASVLEKVGADKIIFPEKEMGMRIARNLSANAMEDVIEIGDDYSIVEAAVPRKWIGKSLAELNPRKEFGFNVIAKKVGRYARDIVANLDPNIKFLEGEHIIVIGKNENLDKIF